MNDMFCTTSKNLSLISAANNFEKEHAIKCQPIKREEAFTCFVVGQLPLAVVVCCQMTAVTRRLIGATAEHFSTFRTVIKESVFVNKTGESGVGQGTQLKDVLVKMKRGNTYVMQSQDNRQSLKVREWLQEIVSSAGTAEIQVCP